MLTLQGESPYYPSGALYGKTAPFSGLKSTPGHTCRMDYYRKITVKEPPQDTTLKYNIEIEAPH